MTGTVPPSVRELWAVVDRLAPRDEAAWEARPPLRRGRPVSKSRALQLRATLRQLATAVGHPDMPERAALDVEELLSPEGVDVFLDLAWTGALRDPGKPALLGRPLSLSQVGTFRDCLKILGEELGLDLVLPRVGREASSEPVSLGQARVVFRKLADMAAGAPGDAWLARTAAVAGVLLDTGMQTAGVVSRRLDDLDLVAGRLRCVYRMQNAAHMPVVEETVPLSEGTVVAVRGWLRCRRVLVEGLEGADPGALWVTVQAASQRGVDGGWVTYAAGMPLGEWGAREAHSNGVDRVNTALAGRWVDGGVWVPAARCPEQFRRAVDVGGLVPELGERFEETRPEAKGRVFGLVHGRASGYRTYGCRCKRCTRAATLAQARWRAKSKAARARPSDVG